jgi:hypothetical protein
MNTDKVIFFDKAHTYWYSGRKMPSVGSLIDKYFPKFDQDFWLYHGVLKEEFQDEYIEHYRSFETMKPNANKLFDKFVDRMGDKFIIKYKELSETWEFKREFAAFRGTNFHSKQELEAFSKGYIVNPWDQMGYAVNYFEKEFDNQSLTLNLFDLPDGVYPELLIFDLKLWLAGQADEVYIQTIGNTRYIDINDHKTNEKKPSKSDPNSALYPFQDRYASTDFKYTFQINTYAYMLARAGFTVRNMAYSWYKDYDTQSVIRVDVENIQDRLKIILC